MKVSIVVPVYNMEKYLENCLKSLINQEYRDIEILLINDGSVDNSLNICEIFQKSDNRIKVFNKDNEGVGETRNYGIKKATGELITFVDADDAISKDFISENIFYFLENNHIDVVQVPIYHNYEGQNPRLVSYPNIKIMGNTNLFRSWIIENKISWISCGKIYKRRLFDDLKFDSSMFYEDNFLLPDLLMKIDTILLSSKGIYYYYFRENSITTSIHSLKKEKDTQKVILNILSKLNKIENIENAIVIMLSRFLNVAISLKVNHKENNKGIPETVIISFNKINYKNIFQASLPLAQKLKLLCSKCLGVKTILEYY